MFLLAESAQHTGRAAQAAEALSDSTGPFRVKRPSDEHRWRTPLLSPLCSLPTTRTVGRCEIDLVDGLRGVRRENDDGGASRACVVEEANERGDVAQLGVLDRPSRGSEGCWRQGGRRVLTPDNAGGSGPNRASESRRRNFADLECRRGRPKATPRRRGRLPGRSSIARAPTR